MPTDLELTSLLQSEDPSWVLNAAPIVTAGRRNRRRRRGALITTATAVAVIASLVPHGLHRGRASLTASKPTATVRLPSPDGELLPTGERSPMPSVAGVSTAGKTLSLSALQGEPVVVPVFGSWCLPCGTDAKAVEGLYTQNKSESSGFLGVAVRDETTSERAFAERHREDFPTLVADPATSTALESVGATGVPELLLVDRGGRLAARIAGVLDAGALSRVAEDLTALRAETDDPTVNGLTLDGGALRVVPAPAGTKAGWGTAAEALDQAKESLPQFTSSGAAPIISPVTVQLARVTLTGRPAYTDRLSWVVSFRTDDRNTFYGCDLDTTQPPQPIDTSVHQGYVVVIQDATTGGDGVTYTERPTAPRCGSSHSR